MLRIFNDYEYFPFITGTGQREDFFNRQSRVCLLIPMLHLILQQRNEEPYKVRACKVEQNRVECAATRAAHFAGRRWNKT